MEWSGLMKKQNLPPVNARQKCKTGHIPYADRMAAQAACEEHIADAKRNGLQGKSWKRLNIYRCRLCGNWHVGHAKEKLPDWRKERQEQQAAQQPKHLTEGQARRKAEHERKKAERHAQRAKLFEDYAENLRYCDILLARELLLTARSH